MPSVDKVYCITTKGFIRKKSVVARKASFVGDIALHGNAFNKLNSSNRLSVIPAT